MEVQTQQDKTHWNTFSNLSTKYAKFFWELGSKRMKIVLDTEGRVFVTNIYVQLLVIMKLNFLKEIKYLLISFHHSCQSPWTYLPHIANNV